MGERMFPIIDGPAIPWAAIAPHERQAQFNHGQTLERLAERGGLCPSEAVAVLEDRRWERLDKESAKARLLELTRDTVRLEQLERIAAAATALLAADRVNATSEIQAAFRAMEQACDGFEPKAATP